jgi:predicted GNAT family acetyltransferase
MDRFQIQHDPVKREFFTLIDGEKSYVAYCMLDPHTVDFYRTFVPDQFRGSGIAKALVDIALDYADQQRWRIIASCWYAAMVLKRRERDSGRQSA